MTRKDIVVNYEKETNSSVSESGTRQFECGGQKISCECTNHDKQFASWKGFWPGELECKALNMDLNTFYMTGMHKIFFVKPR